MSSFHPRNEKNKGWGVVILPFVVLLIWLIGSVAFFVNLPKITSHSPSTSSAPATVVPGHDMNSMATSGEIAGSATDIPSPITRSLPMTVRYDLTTSEVISPLSDKSTYRYWTFNGTVPGPMMRVMVGDTVEIHITNAPGSSLPHSIDLHAVSGPGGGSNLTQTIPGVDTLFKFKAMNTGLYIYHCATPPVPDHVANGMFGMILVEPVGGLPKVDREYYVVQSEMYTVESFGSKGEVHYDAAAVMAEKPTYYVLNGRMGSLTKTRALNAKVGETVRIYFGVGTFKPSNFHVIGGIFDTVYPEGGIGGMMEKNVGLTTVPAGGTTIVEMTFKTPGTYLIVDHSLNRTVLGAVGQIVVTGAATTGMDEPIATK